MRRMDTNRSAGSIGEVDETIERRMTAEVEEHTNLKWRGAKVTDQLWPGGRRELFSRFVLDDHRVIHDHVQPLPRDMSTLVADRNRKLPGDPVPAVGPID